MVKEIPKPHFSGDELSNRLTKRNVIQKISVENCGILQTLLFDNFLFVKDDKFIELQIIYICNNVNA